MERKKYGLFTAITMIIGIVIGSGIFFKSDNILIATDGSVIMGVVIFTIAALCVILGCLNIAELASRCNKPGGIITYAEEFCGNKTASAFGWFQTFLYYPTLIIVVTWVTGIYTCTLLGINSTLETQLGIGIIFLIFIFIVNSLSVKLGGIFQNASTLIKLIPLILIACGGLFLNNDVSVINRNDLQMLSSTSWLAAIAPIAFSFDGWIVSTSISHEIKNSQKNLPLALIGAPLFVLAIYILYFVGISTLIGPEQIIALGDEHVYLAANKILGNMGAKILIIFIIISVLGTLNGLVIGFIRLPYSLALRGMLPNSNKLKVMNEKYSIPTKSAILALIICFFWLVIHYLTQKYNILPNSDVSEIATVMSYVLYSVLYIQVFKLGTRGDIKGFTRGRLVPCLGLLGSFVILLGGFSNSLFIVYCLICFVILLSGALFYKKQENK